MSMAYCIYTRHTCIYRGLCAELHLPMTQHCVYTWHTCIHMHLHLAHFYPYVFMLGTLASIDCVLSYKPHLHMAEHCVYTWHTCIPMHLHLAHLHPYAFTLGTLASTERLCVELQCYLSLCCPFFFSSLLLFFSFCSALYFYVCILLFDCANHLLLIFWFILCLTLLK